MSKPRTKAQKRFDIIIALVWAVLFVAFLAWGWEISYERAVKTHPGHLVSGAGN